MKGERRRRRKEEEEEEEEEEEQKQDGRRNLSVDGERHEYARTRSTRRTASSPVAVPACGVTTMPVFPTRVGAAWQIVVLFMQRIVEDEFNSSEFNRVP